MLTDFSTRKQMSGWYPIALFVAADFLLAALINLLFATRLFDPIVRATGGLITRTLIGNLPGLLGIVLVGMIWLGKLKPADLGLVWPKILPGVLFTIGLWLLVQITEAVFGLARNGVVTLNSNWSQLGITAIIGHLIGQIFGNALYEDIAYRGFLLLLVFYQFNRRWPQKRWQPFIAALLISQILFALRHIPGLLLQGQTVVDTVFSLLPKLMIGLLYALLYFRTKNLFLVIGVHVLTDEPTALFSAAIIEPEWLVLLFALIALILWPAFTGQPKKPVFQEITSALPTDSSLSS